MLLLPMINLQVIFILESIDVLGSASTIYQNNVLDNGNTNEDVESDDGDADQGTSRKETCCWRKRQLLPVDTGFLGSHSGGPTEVLSPLEYFKQFFNH